jgi:outer membrane protein OmpA-like peptidoglycan-associated protein
VLKRQIAPITILALLLSIFTGFTSPSYSAGTGEWAEWNFTSNTAGTLRLNSDSIWPRASFTITGGTGSRVSGSTAFLNAGTPIGEIYGTSRDKPYASIGLPISSTVPGTASVTTFTFDNPTPASGWAFALGDVDAENILITALDASGSSIDVNSWYQSSFNYCNSGSPKPSSCPAGTSTDVPTWTSPNLIGGASDTGGASAWFSPDVQVKTLTFTQSRNVAGGPNYQLWFVTTASPAPTPTPPPAVIEVEGIEDLEPGEVLAIDDGLLVDAIVEPNDDATALDVSVNEWTMSIGATTSEGEPSALDSEGFVVAQPDTVIEVSGTSFFPGTQVGVYLVDESEILGTTRVDAGGSFSGSFAIPAGLASGTYVVQVNGYGPAMALRSTSMGIRLANPRRVILRRTVYFDVLSPRLDARSQAVLNGLINRVPKNAYDVQVRSVGFVQPTINRDNDESLSFDRARRTARYLRSNGIKGSYVINAKGRAKQTDWQGRRATVTVSYTVLR